MNMNTTAETTDIVGQSLNDLITLKQYVIVLESCAVVWTILSAIGVASNVINIKTFISMGLNDGVTVSFLALAVFDMAYLLTSLSLGLSVALVMLEMKSGFAFPIQPYGISIILSNIMFLINVWNVLTTTFLAIEKCMCVARPLQFKNAFTKRRTLVILTVFFLFPVVLYTPLLANIGMVPKFDPTVNFTRPMLWLSDSRQHIAVIIWIISDMFLPVSTQLIVMACVVVMANCLRASARFRQASTVTDVTTKKDASKTQANDDETDAVEKDNGTKTPSNKLSGKDLKVVQQVVLISAVYIVCNLPKVLISLTSALDSRFSMNHQYHLFYIAVSALRKHFEIFNSSVNLPIYYKYNTKFRKLCGL